MKKPWQAELRAIGACDQAQAGAAGYSSWLEWLDAGKPLAGPNAIPSRKEAWRRCLNPEWMLWILRHYLGDQDTKLRKVIPETYVAMRRRVNTGVEATDAAGVAVIRRHYPEPPRPRTGKRR